ncbi:MAG: TetR/AcrR family transcriptional regulator [Hyphomicrobiaceae bacterium]|nr:TetR/AcrR family transcriptional regulator [Hyphomicrobiaceae bacterium]
MKKAVPHAPQTDAGGPPRQRILAAACELFYKHGIRSVGVEAVAEAASTNKMTLYRHFGSKDELIVAYLQQVAEESDGRWQNMMRSHAGDFAAQVEAWLGYVEQVVSDFGERGCPMANAAVELQGTEHPALRIIEDYKARKRRQLVAMLGGAGYANPERVADEVFLLFEGARISRQCYSVRECPSTRLVEMLRSLLESHRSR